ncbi:mannose-6-phosphate isomerase, class I [Endozoicomonas sp. (ex Bugula neritina AB1)]|nr:mannose-6-phosphate isomerase, class I [Endozoicomonas sp. (ex Bugula neritina AB1)]
MLYRLTNPIQNYAWGSTTSMNKLFGIANDEGKPQAEMWMGAHPNGCSTVEKDGKTTLLSDLIAANPIQVLGNKVYQQFGADLPYLLKILAADKPLSIQVHPEKSKAASGFARENKMGLAPNAANRNYKDGNHKPELVYALTPYKAMNGFRVIKETVALFEQAGVDILNDQVAKLKANPDAEHLETFFKSLLSMEGELKDMALDQLMTGIDSKGSDEAAKFAFATIKDFAEEYPDDVGLFSPLMLNLIVLQPGEAMFLHAETPHAYLKGTGVEIMANSDNVLRAGLTPKYMDIPELIANTQFTPIQNKDLHTAPVVEGGTNKFPVPVDDFAIEVTNIDGQTVENKADSAEIILCLKGEVSITNNGQSLTLKPSESAFIEAQAGAYQCEGNGQFVRISA